MSFPVEFLRPGDEIVCVFSAAFLGKNAEVYIRDAGHKRVTCVDLDAAKLEEMRPAFPNSWEFVAADAYLWMPAAPLRSCDVLVLDPWTGDMGTVMRQIGAWSMIARRLVIVGVCAAWAEEERVGDMGLWFADRGLTLLRFPLRSDYRGGVYWAVCEVTP